MFGDLSHFLVIHGGENAYGCIHEVEDVIPGKACKEPSQNIIGELVDSAFTYDADCEHPWAVLHISQLLSVITSILSKEATTDEEKEEKKEAEGLLRMMNFSSRVHQYYRIQIYKFLPF